MSIFNTKHKRKSFVITTSILLLILFLIFNFGMTYLDPPQEYGLAINFADSNVGKGDFVQETKKIQTTKVVEQEQKEEVIEETVKEPITEEVIKEDIITDDTNTDVPIVEKKEEELKEKKNTEEIEKPKEKVKEKPKSKPSKEATDALNSLLNANSSVNNAESKGDDNVEGLKGKQTGNLNSKKYYGNIESGSNGNYNLAGRQALSKPIEKPECQEEGIVVVRIEVDKNGKVIKAVPGVKGSTNNADCLLEPAKSAALKTTWNADKKAPSKQIGTIIYNFTLSK